MNVAVCTVLLLDNKWWGFHSTGDWLRVRRKVNIR